LIPASGYFEWRELAVPGQKKPAKIPFHVTRNDGVPMTFAGFETNLRRERQMEGIAKAKANGVYKVRRASIEAARIIALKEGGMAPAVIARELKVARPSVCRVLRKEV
jgi:DNA invertase Pin-like site-specific DNA recombinase